MRKLYVILSVLVVAATLLAACQPSSTPAAPTTTAPTAAATNAATEADCAKPEVWCVGFVTDVGEIDDKSFNQSGWEGVQTAKANFNAIVNYVETKDAKDYEANIKLFVDKKYDVIVTSGFAIGATTAEVAKANPTIKFIGVDQFQAETIPNYVGLVFHEDQAGYLAGVLAASLTKSGKIAGVFGTNLVPPVVAFKEGFELGAKATKPDIQIISTYHPGGLDVAFTDPEWGATTAKQALDQGADVVFGAGGKTGNGALGEVAGHTGMFCIGVDTDQWETVPEAHPCLVSSAMKLIKPGLEDLLTQIIKDGKSPSGNYFGPVGLAPFHDFDSTIAADLKAKLTQIADDLKTGKLQTGYTPSP
jgi:basic membrane protein A